MDWPTTKGQGPTTSTLRARCFFEFVHQIGLGKVKPPVFAHGAESFQSNLKLAGPFHWLYPHDLKLDPALAILQSELVPGLQRVVDRSQTGSVRCDVQGMRQFVYRIIG